ncbi:auxin transport protein BIG [Tanacetum coccineum]
MLESIDPSKQIAIIEHYLYILGHLESIDPSICISWKLSSSALEMLVPGHAVGNVMGRGRANVDNIRKTSEASVEISDNKSSCGDRYDQDYFPGKRKRGKDYKEGMLRGTEVTLKGLKRKDVQLLRKFKIQFKGGFENAKVGGDTNLSSPFVLLSSDFHHGGNLDVVAVAVVKVEETEEQIGSQVRIRGRTNVRWLFYDFYLPQYQWVKFLAYLEVSLWSNDSAHSTFTWGKRSRNKMLKLAWVVTAQEQVVVGTLHHLTLEIDDAEGKKRYLAKIWVKPWENFKELQEFNYILHPDHDGELKLKDFHIVNEAEVLAGRCEELHSYNVTNKILNVSGVEKVQLSSLLEQVMVLLHMVPWTNERPLENRELNAIIGAWFTLWRD